MSGELAKGFLNDIVANIDDDTPRLVYADWLTENGQDDRAEFIRVQCERARLPAWDAAQIRLRLREQELLKQYGEQWLAELPDVEGVKWEGFRRGIVAEVSFANFEAMRKSVHACRAVAPVEAVTVRWPRKREAKKAPAIAELRELSLTGMPMEDEVGWLADSPQLATLRCLTARGLWADVLEVLVASPHLAALKVLRLPTNNLGNAGLQALTGASSLKALEELDVSGMGRYERYNTDPIIRAAGMGMLIGWASLVGVRSLNLNGNDISRDGLRALLRSPNAASLEELSLRDGRLNGQAMAEFADAVKGLRLKTLDLGENVLKEVGLEYLATAKCLRELKSLRIDRCEIPLAGARAMAKKGTFLGSLQLLDIGHNRLGPAGLEAILKCKPALHTLRIRDNDLFDKGVTALATSPASNGLLEVDLSQNAVGPMAVQALGDSEHLSELQVLHLGDNKISAEMAKTLAASPLGQRLSILDFAAAPPPEEMSEYAEEVAEYYDEEFPLGDGEIPF